MRTGMTFIKSLFGRKNAGERNIYKEESRRLPEVMPMGKGRPSKCPQCGSLRSVAKGFRYRAKGKAKDKKCSDCGRRYLVEIREL